jgi:hypothetical protein
MQTTMARIGGDPSLATLRRRPEPYNPQWALDVSRAVERESGPAVGVAPVNIYDAGQRRGTVCR